MAETQCSGRTYDSKLVGEIERKVHIEVEQGFAIEVRPVPDDERRHAVDPRVIARQKQQKAGASASPAGNDVLSMRTRPIKKTCQIDNGTTSERTIAMNFGDRTIYAYSIEPQELREDAPLVVFVHGGGFSSGEYRQYRFALRYLAEIARVPIYFPVYRLAPEAPFPQGLEDCVQSLDWLVGHRLNRRVVLIGDSAGGSLVNALYIRRRDAADIRLMVELYPLVDANSDDRWSLDAYTYLPDQKEIAQARIMRLKGSSDQLAEIYAQGDSSVLVNPLVSAQYDANLGSYPRMLIIASEFDYLRLQNERFAKTLHDAGVSVRCIRYGGCDHGFFECCGVMPQVEDLCNLIAKELEKI